MTANATIFTTVHVPNIPDKCLDTKTREYMLTQVKESLGHGSYGSVYPVCLKIQRGLVQAQTTETKNDCTHHVLKAIPFKKDLDGNDLYGPLEFENETMAGIVAGHQKIGLGPVVYDYWSCSLSNPAKKFGFILMERLDDFQPLSVFYGKLPLPNTLPILQRLLPRLNRFWAGGWTHGDINSGNLFISTRPHDDDSRLIDFGASKPLLKSKKTSTDSAIYESIALFIQWATDNYLIDKDHLQYHDVIVDLYQLQSIMSLARVPTFQPKLEESMSSAARPLMMSTYEENDMPGCCGSILNCICFSI